MLLILEAEMLRYTLNEIMMLLQNVTFSDKTEIFNYSHTHFDCTVIFTLMVNLLATTVMYIKSINLYVQLEVFIFKNFSFCCDFVYLV
jgi:hypothetical protein